jgi:hypothetical protein
MKWWRKYMGRRHRATRGRKNYNEFHVSYFSTNITMAIASKKSAIGGIRDSHAFGRNICREKATWQQKNIKMRFNEKVCKDMDGNQLAHDRVRWRTLANVVMILLVPQTRGMSWPAYRLSASWIGSCSVELVICDKCLLSGAVTPGWKGIKWRHIHNFSLC